MKNNRPNQNTQLPDEWMDLTPGVLLPDDEQTRHVVLDDKTRRASGDEEKTRHYRAHDKSGKHSLQDSAVEYVLHGDTYVFKQWISKGTTGEADVALITKGQKRYALKLYYPGFIPKQEVLSRLGQLGNNSFIVPLLDTGIWKDELNDEERAFELMPFIEHPALNQIKLNKNEQALESIALEAAKCIDLCHKNGILHKDIKPGNFFYANTNGTRLLISDFGVSDLLDNLGYSFSVQGGTTIYNAPEMYRVDGNTVRLTAKSDFYSLGIMLMSLWMGETKFRAEMDDHEGPNRIFELQSRKERADLPYPTDLKDKLLTLIKGLTIYNEKDRWGYEEIQKWKKGDFKLMESLQIINRPFIYDEKKQEIAHSPAQLAEMMYYDRSFAIKALRRGKVSEWLRHCNRDRLATEIEDILETTEDDMAMLRMCIYTLDQEFPYYGMDGKPCKTASDLACEICTLHPDSAELTDPDSDFYCYLKTHGLESRCEEFVAIAESGVVNPQWQIAYQLDINLPFPVLDQTNHIRLCETPAEVLDTIAACRGEIDLQQKLALLSPAFLYWLNACNSEAIDRFYDQKEGIESGELVWCLLYNMDLNRSFELTLTETQEVACHKTIHEIAAMLDDAAVQYICVDKGNEQMVTDQSSFNLITDLVFFEHSRLFFYLKSKRVFEKQIDWIKHCCDFKSTENTKKCTPYYQSTAIFKAIKGLMSADKNPHYYFTKSKIRIATLAETTKIPQEEMKHEIKKEFVTTWIALFFHEDPYTSFSTKYKFEEQVEAYLRFIGRLDDSYYPVVRFREAQSEICGNLQKIHRKIKLIRAIRIALALLLIIPALIMLIYFAVNKFPYNENPLPGFSSVILIMGLVIGLILAFTNRRYYSFRTNMKSGMVIAFIIYYAIYLVLAFVMPLASWLFVGTFGTLAFLASRNCLLRLSLQTKSHAHLIHLDSDFDQMVVQPLFFAFKSNDAVYHHKYAARLSHYKDYLDGIKRGLLKRGSVLFLIFISILIFLFGIGLFSSGKSFQTTNPYAPMSGEWSGVFEGREAKMTVTVIDSESATAEVSVKFTNWSNELFTVSYFYKSKDYMLTDNNPENGILDGSFIGVLSNGSNEFSGTYSNKKTAREYPFSFHKINQE